MNHDYHDLIQLFNDTFAEFNTRLVKGQDEPEYLPASEACPYHRIIFAHGYFASALHEIAHWCIAGSERRMKVDYGYWYCPDGRDENQQRAFELVERKPQAIEWAFSLAAGVKFNVSVDNLEGAPVDRESFKREVARQAIDYLQSGFPPRAQRFIRVLCERYRQSYPEITQFTISGIQEELDVAL